jgi:hypothetical protein
MAVFAQLVEGVLLLGRGGIDTVTGAAFAGFNALVVAGRTVFHAGLMGLMLEGHGAHFGFELDGFLTFVGGRGHQGAGGQESDREQYSDKTFHASTSIEKGWFCERNVRYFEKSLLDKFI